MDAPCISPTNLSFIRQFLQCKRSDRTQRTDPLLLISYSFSCGFSLFTPFYGRGFIELLLAKVADYTVARTLSLETSYRAFNGFVFAYFDG